jgi:hypothetical protein
MQLIGADEVHLAGDRRVVARIAQRVHGGRHAGRQLRGVVVNADR